MSRARSRARASDRPRGLSAEVSGHPTLENQEITMKHSAEKIAGILAVIILVICQSAFELKAKVSRAQAREEPMAEARIIC